LHTYVEEKRARVRSRRGRDCAKARTGRGVLDRTWSPVRGEHSRRWRSITRAQRFLPL